MGKLGISTGYPKADLSNVIVDDNNNSRKTYDKAEIEERARSIEDLSQLEPVIVQKSKEFPGKLILVSGFCRFYAHKLLVNEGKDYSQIEYVIKTGDPFMINLAENIQRSNLNSLDIESALKKMSDEGMKPQQIATKLKKPVSWVCDRIKSGQVRSVIKEDTSEISSSALSQLRNLPEETINKIIPEIKSKGGTVKNTKEIVDLLKEKTKDKNKSADIIVTEAIKDKVINDTFSALYREIDHLIHHGVEEQVIIKNISTYIEGLK